MNIKSTLTTFAAVTGIVLSIMTAPALATQAASDHDHGHTAELKLNNGTKWAVDAPLSRAMNNIRNAMAKETHAIHANELAEEKYLALADGINNDITYMVQNCKLEPEADAQLHLIIADLAEGTTAMKDKTSAQHGAEKVMGAIEKYATYFDDPDFKPLN